MLKTEKDDFDERARARIKSLFAEQFIRKNHNVPPTISFIEAEAEIFIKTLEKWGLSIPDFEKHNSPKQQKRRETIQSMQSSLLSFIDQFSRLDSAASGFLFLRGIEEVSKTTGEQNPFPEDIRTSLFVHNHKDQFIKELSAFQIGMLKAVKELPVSQDKPIELRIALWIERLFWERGIQFTTSETGFASECLRFTLAMGEIDKDRVGHWLAKASKDKESMTALVATKK